MATGFQQQNRPSDMVGSQAIRLGHLAGLCRDQGCKELAGGNAFAKGDPAAIPILEKLLESRVAQMRLIAAEGLEEVGEAARCSVPALLRVLDDKDETVRQQVEQALFRIDRETAERVGLQWTIMGLTRRE
jgi:hypothetical protein